MKVRTAPAALLLLLVLVSRPTSAAEEVTILYPPDLALVTEGKVKVFAMSPDNAAQIPIRVNGLVSGQLEGGAFRKGEVPLNGGMNIMRIGSTIVRIYQQSDAKGSEVRVPGRQPGETLVFRALRLHQALDDGCEGCHTVDGGKLSQKPQKESCYACHDNYEKDEPGRKKYVHTPVAQGECTGCHEPHFSSLPKLQKSAKGCAECHDPFPSEGSVHDPVERGECASCHGPHIGVAPKQLVREGNALCLGCHEKVHRQHISATVSDPNKPIRVPADIPREKGNLSCVGCHLPHQSAERLLFRKEQGKLCKTCHIV